jgi:hypothetical protein
MGTALNDCIVLVFTTDTGHAPVASGCGATWVANHVTNSSAWDTWVFVGYACAAGGTSITVSTTGGAITAEYVLGVFSGVLSSSSPIRSVATGTGSSGTITTGTLTYVAGDLLVGGAGFNIAGDSFTLPATWSNGGTDNTIGSSVTQRSAASTYQISGSGTTTTYSIVQPHGGGFPAVVALALEPSGGGFVLKGAQGNGLNSFPATITLPALPPPPSGDMLTVLGL